MTRPRRSSGRSGRKATKPCISGAATAGLCPSSIALRARVDSLQRELEEARAEQNAERTQEPRKSVGARRTSSALAPFARRAQSAVLGLGLLWMTLWLAAFGLGGARALMTIAGQARVK